MSEETLIEKLRGYKSTPRHCEELCYEASNEIESLRQQLADSQKQVTLLRDALKSIHAIEDKLFGPDWEEIDEARDIVNVALAATADLDGLILCHAEPVAYLDANYGFMRCGNVADSLSIGTQLYAPKMEPKNSSV